MNSYIEEWGEPYPGRILSSKGLSDNTEDQKTRHLWDIKVKNPKKNIRLIMITNQ